MTDDTVRKWELTDSGWWVVEAGGQIRTGPFQTQEQAKAWYDRELDIELDTDDMDATQEDDDDK